MTVERHDGDDLVVVSNSRDEVGDIWCSPNLVHHQPRTRQELRKNQPKIVEDVELVEDSGRTTRDVNTFERDEDLASIGLRRWY